jgi:hypothetical protein
MERRRKPGTGINILIDDDPPITGAHKGNRNW